MLPGLIWSVLGVEEPGHSDEKWAPGTSGQEMRTGRCWNATMQVSPAEGVT